MKRNTLLKSIILLTLLVQSFAALSPAYAGDWQDLSPDIDGDGLSNDLEQTGWYNAAGGPFTTDPLDADSDDDGLTDGEEKAFDTHPKDIAKPGIYVRYRDIYQTKEYFRPASINPIYPPDNEDYFPKKAGYAYLLTRQAGDDYLMTPESGDGGMVARRGTTLHIGGPSTATLTLTGNGLTALTVQPYDAYSSGWTVDIPANGTVGTYTATLSADGTAIAQMPIYVIFQLPNDLSQDEVEAFVYNDDIDDQRDETAVVWFSTDPSAKPYTYRCDSNGDNPPCYNVDNYYRATSNWSQSFPTQQFEKWIFVDQVIWRIHGETNPGNAVDILSSGADYEVRVNYDNLGQWYDPDGPPLSYRIDYVMRKKIDWSDPEHRLTQKGTACHAQAGVLTSFLRAAGIPADPFIVDWRNSSNDHSVRVWLGSWYGARSYSGGEHGNDAYEHYPFDHGETNKAPLAQWDARGSYGAKNNTLVTVNEHWVWDMVNTANVYTDRSTPGTAEYRWESQYPLRLIYKHPYVDTLNSYIWYGSGTRGGWPDAYSLPQPYYGGNLNEDWPVEPVAQGCPDGFTGDCPYPNVVAGKVWQDSDRDGILDSGELGIPDVVVTLTLTSPQTVYTTTTNGLGNYSFDYFREFSEAAGGTTKTLWFQGLPGGNYELAVNTNTLPPNLLLTTGNHPLPFSILDEESKTDVNFGFGPDGLGPAPSQARLAFTAFSHQATALTAQLLPQAPVTSNLSDSPFLEPLPTPEPPVTYAPAQLGEVVQDLGIDADKDGLYDALAIDVTVLVNQPGRYAVGALLGMPNGMTAHGGIHAQQDELRYMNAGEHIVRLTFAGEDISLEGGAGPYYLANIWLTDLENFDPHLGPWEKVLDQQFPAYATAAYDAKQFEAPIADVADFDLGHAAHPDTGSARFKPPASTGNNMLYGAVISPTNTITGYALDLDNNGLYDQLALDASIEVTPSGRYRLEGWLQDAEGALVSYGVGQAVDLISGTHTISMTWDGPQIRAHGLVSGPYTVVNLRILDASVITYTVLDEILQTGSLDYTADEFEPFTDAVLVFGDDMESGTSHWTWGGLWSLADKSWPVATHLWQASSTSGSGLLDTLTLNLSQYAQPVLYFNTTYSMSTSSLGAVQLFSQSTWITDTIYTTAFDRQRVEVVDLAQFSEMPNVKARFSANAQDDLRWYVDDVYLYAWPAVTSASFTYTPTVPQSNQVITFVASYNALTTTLPITYTWDFGDGSGTHITASPIITHEFPDGQSRMVHLVVTNPYDSAERTIILSVSQPIQETSFNYTPLVPEIDTDISFSTTFTPTDATPPITYTWNFGDGASLITDTTTITHKYAEGGDYNVLLTTHNDYGTATDNHVITIKEGVSDVSFNHEPLIPLEGDAVAFNAAFARDTASHPITYTWNFGDGSADVITTTPNVAHTFASVGYYTVSLMAYNAYGMPQHYSDTLHIDGRPVSAVSFEVMEIQPPDGYTGIFTPTYMPVDATQPITYIWNFDDGDILVTTSPTASHQFTFTTPTTFSVWLTATNGYETQAITYSLALLLPFDDDGDGLSNSDEVNIYGTDPQNPDTDGDGRSDGEEIMGYVYDTYASHDDYGTHIYTDPLDPDSDDDGAEDGTEFNIGSHPNDFDTDDDGLEDGNEPGLNSTPHPLDPDTDDDGLLDGEEWYTYCSDPVVSASDHDRLIDGMEVYTTTTELCNPDTDSDTRGDGDEWYGYIYTSTITTTVHTDHPDYGQLITTTPVISDTDADGLTDGEEFAIGTHPGDADTDADDIDDFTEVADNAGIVGASPVDTDSDGVIDAFDDDSDADGKSDAAEGTGDIDNDSLPNWRDADDNYPPVAVDDVADTDEDTAIVLPVTQNDTDLDEDDLTLTAAGTVTQGQLLIGSTTLTYTPDADIFGMETFSYTVTDGVWIASAYVTLTIHPVDDAPRFTSQPTLTATEDLTYTYAIATSDADPGDSLTLTAPTLPAWLTFSDQGGGLGTVSGTPANNDVGIHEVALYVQDTTSLTATQQFTLTVYNVNDAPVVGDIPNQTIDEGGDFATLILDDYVSDADDAPDTLTWTYSGHTELGLSLVGRVLTITVPHAEWSGSETLVFTATDPGGLSSRDVATFTVMAVNDPPVVSGMVDQATDEGGTFVPILLDNYVDDIDNTDAEMTWTYSGNVALLVNLFERVVTVTVPGPDWNGRETMVFTATDPGGLSSSAHVTFTVNGTNDSPVVSDIPDQSIDEGSAFAAIHLDTYVTDDNVPAEMTWTYSGQSDLNVTLAGRVLTLTMPHADWYGRETLVFTATDPGGLSASDVATFTVNPVNDPPVAVSDSYSISRGSILTITAPGILANDVDVEYDVLTVTLVSGVHYGQLTLQTDGAFVYIHDGSLNLNDSFTYRAHDGSTYSEVATVTLNGQSNDAFIYLPLTIRQD